MGKGARRRRTFIPGRVRVRRQDSIHRMEMGGGHAWKSTWIDCLAVVVVESRTTRSRATEQLTRRREQGQEHAVVLSPTTTLLNMSASASASPGPSPARPPLLAKQSSRLKTHQVAHSIRAKAAASPSAGSSFAPSGPSSPAPQYAGNNKGKQKANMTAEGKVVYKGLLESPLLVRWCVSCRCSLGYSCHFRADQVADPSSVSLLQALTPEPPPVLYSPHDLCPPPRRRRPPPGPGPPLARAAHRGAACQLPPRPT